MPHCRPRELSFHNCRPVALAVGCCWAHVRWSHSCALVVNYQPHALPSALAASGPAARMRGGAAFTVADDRADAWGHGHSGGVLVLNDDPAATAAVVVQAYDLFTGTQLLFGLS